jgi:hypothetical protein
MSFQNFSHDNFCMVNSGKKLWGYILEADSISDPVRDVPSV